MDSLTQITLGAAVGEAVLGRPLGNKAILWGAVFGTLPDLDGVIAPFVDSVGYIVHHRAISHSLLAVAVLSPLFARLFYRWYGGAISFGRWLSFFLLVFLTHIFLDCCTNYGTQIFQPFSDARIAWNAIFAIDPLYTLPFLSCVIACWFLKPDSLWRRRINATGLILSTGYLLAAFAFQHHAKDVFSRALADRNIDVRRMMVSPTPFNTVLWYCAAEDDDGYHVGFYSLFDTDEEFEFQDVPRSEDLLGDLVSSFGVDRLIWFADGYYAARKHPDGVVFHVLKFGKLNLLENGDHYPFSYLIRRSNPAVVIEPYEAPREESVRDLAAKLWRRICGERRDRA